MRAEDEKVIIRETCGGAQPDSSLQCSFLLHCASRLCCSTLLYSALLSLCSRLLESIACLNRSLKCVAFMKCAAFINFRSTLPYSAALLLPYSALLCPTLLYSSCSTLLYSALLCSTTVLDSADWIPGQLMKMLDELLALVPRAQDSAAQDTARAAPPGTTLQNIVAETDSIKDRITQQEQSVERAIAAWRSQLVGKKSK